ncbi:M12 family metallo-peptidase [Vaginella massiliensis]|uniref:M12 family metallo-peptidase n=1 Tax=Vaginella massiliensis TaxID=1816680 RepID=UPI000839AD87|nr:M12 family metallo-peptidase [Vaginella massiliensis]
MKKSTILTGLFLFLGSFSMAQYKPIAKEIVNLKTQKATFQKVNLFSSSTNSNKKATVKDAQFLTLDLAALQNFSKKASTNIELVLPYNGKEIVLELTENTQVFDKDFKVTDENYKVHHYKPGKYYKGIIKGDLNSLVGISLFENEVIGVITSEEYGNLNLGALTNEDGTMKKNATEYVMYSDKFLPREELGAFCGADQVLENQDVAHHHTAGKSSSNFDNNRIPTMYFEVDYNIFQYRQRNIDNVLDWLSAMYNNVQLLYANDDIQVVMRSVMVWTTQDPYQNIGTSSLAYLEKFRKTRASFDANVGQLIGVDPGGLGGIAYLNALCTSNNYSYSDINHTYYDFPNYSWNIMVITHEFGHNLGSQHTHACAWNGNNTAIDGCYTLEGNCANPGLPTNGGTIMSYCHLQSVGINLNNGFGPQPRQRIIDFINSRTCLPTDLDNVCITYHPEYQVTNVTENGATIQINLTNNEVIDWNYKLSRYNQAIPSTWSTQENSNTFTFTDLQPNTYYRLRVRKACDTTNPSGVDLIFTTAGDFCNNDLQFVDFGGPNGNYTPNENWTRTIVPHQAGSKLKVEFTSFKTEAGNDIMRVYDGLNTDAEELSPSAGLSGNLSTNLPTFEATNEQGALTFKFTSDNGVQLSGWTANVSCSTLGVNDNAKTVDFSYYPNPVQDELNFVSKVAVKSIEIFSLDGKKVLAKSFNNVFSTNISMKQLPAGSYVVVVNFDGRSTSFKVVKK